MVGPLSGKVISCAYRAKDCRVCNVAEKAKKEPKPHECCKNYDGTSKAMEADMVIEMVKEVQATHSGLTIDAIIGDEDSTTIARLRASVNPEIEKLSDNNHLKKLFGNALYNLRSSHSSLTVTIIKYIQKCFNYAVAQGKGNPRQIAEDIRAIPGHIHGLHQQCSSRWCKFIGNPCKKYKSLPHGKPLQDGPLHEALKELLLTYVSNAERLSCLGSTQANESFNRMVSAKAPKSNHYSSSSNLKHRIAACVAQKNEGHNYLVMVKKIILLKLTAILWYQKN